MTDKMPEGRRPLSAQDGLATPPRQTALVAQRLAEPGSGGQKSGATRLLGSLRDALLAAGRETTDRVDTPAEPERRSDNMPVAVAGHHGQIIQPHSSERQHSMAAETRQGARDQQAGKPAPVAQAAVVVPGVPAVIKAHVPLTGRVPVDPADLSGQTPRTQPAPRAPGSRALSAGGGDARTQLLRGRQKVSRAKFHQDPVVGWLVIVGGPGLGTHRSIYEGNNTVGRASSQRIAIDFGDDTISGEEQAYIRYDSSDRSFLFVPNLAKTNVVQVNDKKPTGAVALQAMDVITMGRTQLVFVPFCGPDFDWAELSDVRE